jgi:hypothetical protein
VNNRLLWVVAVVVAAAAIILFRSPCFTADTDLCSSLFLLENCFLTTVTYNPSLKIPLKWCQSYQTFFSVVDALMGGPRKQFMPKMMFRGKAGDWSSVVRPHLQG